MAQSLPKMRSELVLRQRSIWRAPLCVHEARRTFAVYHRNQATAAAGAQIKTTTKKKEKGQPNFRDVMKKEMKNLKDPTRIPTDLGLLPDTFIMPTGSNLPSLTSNYKTRIGLEWRGLKQRWTDWLSTYIAYRYLIYRTVEPEVRKTLKNPTIDRKSIVPKALSMHQKIYKAFADGKTKVISETCAETLESVYLSRMQRRQQTEERGKWKLEKYIEKSRIVSHKAAATPFELKGMPVGIQQAVVRIRSLQKLTTGRVAMGKVAHKSKERKEIIDWGETKEKDVTEYVVVQRRLLAGEYEPWKVWGFIKEFDLAKELKDIKDKEQKLEKQTKEKLAEAGVV